jgi:hypothetical protein
MKRILSIDGGGIRGLIPAVVCRYIARIAPGDRGGDGLLLSICLIVAQRRPLQTYPPGLASQKRRATAPNSTYAGPTLDHQQVGPMARANWGNAVKRAPTAISVTPICNDAVGSPWANIGSSLIEPAV